MFDSAHISRRLRLATAGFLAASALGVAAPSAAFAGPTDDLLKAVVPAAVTDVIAPVTAAAAPVADPVVVAAKPVTDPVVATATPATQAVEQTVDSVASPVTRPVEQATKPIVDDVSEQVVAPVAKRAAPAAKRIANEIVTPVAKAAAPVAETTRVIADTSPRGSSEASTPSTQRNDRELARRLSARPEMLPVGATTPAAPSTPFVGTARDLGRFADAADSLASLAISDSERPAVEVAPAPSGLTSLLTVTPGSTSVDRATSSDERTRSADDAAVDRTSTTPSRTPDQGPPAPSSASTASSAAGATSNPLPAAFGVLPDPVAAPRPGPAPPASSTPVAELSSAHLVSGSERPG